MRRRVAIVAGVSFLVIAAGGVAAWRWTHPDQRAVCPEGVLKVAAVGDIMMGLDLDPAAQAAPETKPILQAGHVALGSLSMTLTANAQNEDARGPIGSAKHARLLRDWGFTVLARANDHAADFGREGLEATGEVLRRSDLAFAGVGSDLAAARNPVWIQTACGPVAVISLATSLRDGDTATPTRSNIAGRPGVNPLRHQTRLLLDPATYRSLAAQTANLGGAKPGADGRLAVLDKIFEPGERTESVTAVDPRDQAEILAVIADARKTAALVIVSFHSHERGANADAPAPFIQAFARAAVDAGAGLVVGDGPHRVRLLESYRGGLIAYSLGDFIADRRIAASLASNPFDVSDAGPPGGALLSASFKNGKVVSSHLTALDLTAKEPEGFPFLASPQKAQPSGPAS